MRTEIAYGIDVLKVYASGRVDPPAGERGYRDGPLVWSAEEMAALVDEAHRQGVRVAAHAQTLSGTWLAVTAGVDSIEHGFAISPELAAEMAARGTVLVPTLLAWSPGKRPSAAGKPPGSGRACAADRELAGQPAARSFHASFQAVIRMRPLGLP